MTASNDVPHLLNDVIFGLHLLLQFSSAMLLASHFSKLLNVNQEPIAECVLDLEAVYQHLHCSDITEPGLPDVQV